MAVFHFLLPFCMYKCMTLYSDVMVRMREYKDEQQRAHAPLVQVSGSFFQCMLYRLAFHARAAGSQWTYTEEGRTHRHTR